MGAYVNRGRVVRPRDNTPTAQPKPQVGARVDLNDASVDALRQIKGVGKKTAGDIVASREADGPFESLADCAERVGGVSLELLEAADVTV